MYFTDFLIHSQPEGDGCEDAIGHYSVWTGLNMIELFLSHQFCHKFDNCPLRQEAQIVSDNSSLGWPDKPGNRSGGGEVCRVESRLFLQQVISLCRNKIQNFQDFLAIFAGFLAIFLCFWQFFQVFWQFFQDFGNFFKFLATFSSLVPSTVKSWIQPCIVALTKWGLTCYKLR